MRTSVDNIRMVTPSDEPLMDVVDYLTWAHVAAVRSWRWRVLVVLTAISLIMVVGFTRVALGVHYLSDVLGGMAVGLAWLALCLTAADTLRHCRGSMTNKQGS